MRFHRRPLKKFINFVYTPAGLDDATLAIAACRAGGVGILNGEFSPDRTKLIEQIDWLIKKTYGSCGLKLDNISDPLVTAVEEYASKGLDHLIVDHDMVLRHRQWLSRLKQIGLTVLVEMKTAKPPDIPLDDIAGGIIVKGNEAGGLIGENSSYILMQKWLSQTELPLFIHGGITPHVAAACAAVGVAGGIMDSQVLLLQESPLVSDLKPMISKLSGHESIAVGSADAGEYFRLLARPGCEDAKKFAVEAEGKNASDLKSLAVGRIRWNSPASGIIPLGQDVCFAGPWRRQYRHLSDLFRAIDHAVHSNLEISVAHNPFAANSPLAQELKIDLPVVQGPMARVSDNVDLAVAVSKGGGLPTIALALSSSRVLDPLLADAAEKLADSIWGVGILGFAPRDVLDDQFSVIHKYKPRFAIIAGGRAEQAVQLEKSGIKTFLHVPSPDLVSVFMDSGARRFIFEGRECGGHIGPLSSFVLWSRMVDCLLEELQRRTRQPTDIQILFAGGIHDAASAAIIPVLAAPLLKRGVKIGILMGTGYLFTKEIVNTGALKQTFQKSAIDCDNTICLQSGPGHTCRCADTSFAKKFIRKRNQLLEAGVPAVQCREQLDKMVMGRLQLASKGYGRLEDRCGLQSYDESVQQQEGIYMLGQLAILRKAPTDIPTLHRQVTASATAILAKALGRKRPSTKQPLEKPADIAIIGMACLFPKADTIEAYWRNILNKKVAFGDIPDHRWDWRLYYGENRQARDKIYSKWGGFIEDLVFEPTRYGIPPKSIASVDPVQLMALEVARRTLVDAGYEDRQFDREHTSVIIGYSGGAGEVGTQYGLRAELPRFNGDLPDALSRRLPEWTEDTFAGILPNVIAGRIANRLNLGGVNFTTDAACASSLAAIYQGVSELMTGRSNFVVTGGVDSSQSPFGYMCFSKTQALSPRGRCSTFDAGADGIVISEGMAMIAMKRLRDAEKDGDRIYAVIKGVGAGSDGRSKGLTAPEPKGQLRAMQRAYDHAGFGPDAVTMFEAHGTGTVVGDTAELESTIRLLRDAGCGAHHAAIGSVKTLIGHTKAAAGVAGLIKAALSLHNRILPPHFPVKQPNSVLQQEECPLYLPDNAYPWFEELGRKRRAAVSSFGFGGTNFHVALEEYDAEYRPWMRSPASHHFPAELFMWSAGNRQQLCEQLVNLSNEIDEKNPSMMRRLAFSLAEKWHPSEETMTFVVSDADALTHKIDTAVAFLKGENSKLPQDIHYSAKTDCQGKLAVLFSGQGSQYTNMFRELGLHFPVFTRYIGQADNLLKDIFQRRFGERACLSRFIYPRAQYSSQAKADTEKTLRRTDIAQPALGAVGAGLWKLMRWLGLAPDMLGGHSYGEFLALYAAGYLDFPGLMSLSEARGRLIVDAVEKAGKSLGTMAAVQASRQEVEKTISDIADLSLANHNAPKQCVITGAQHPMVEALRRFSQTGISNREIPVAAAFHSSMMKPAQSAFAEAIAGRRWRRTGAGFAVYSNTTGARHSSDVGQIKKTMIDHLVSPVEFVKQIHSMYGDGARIFLELGPKSVLTGLVRRILGDAPYTVVAIDPGSTGLSGLLDACGQLLCAGVNLNVDKLFEARACKSSDFFDPAVMSGAAEVSKSAWVLNNSGSRRFTDPVNPVGIRFETHASQPAVKRTVNPKQPVAIDYQINTRGKKMPKQAKRQVPGQHRFRHKSVMPEKDTKVMVSYFDTMRVFLQTQERVMASYMGASPAPVPRRRRGLLSQQSTGGRSEAVLEIESRPADINRSEVPEVPEVPEQRTMAETKQEAEPKSGERDPAITDSVQQKEAEQIVDRDKLTQVLLSIVEDQTGYPQDMVGLDQNMEADLGIDSIKRVEIASALLKALPAFYRDSIDGNHDKLNTQPTLNGMVEILTGLQPEQGVELPFSRSGAGTAADRNRHPLRYLVEAEPEPIDKSAAKQFDAGVFVLTQDRLGLTEALLDLLKARLCTVVVAGRDLLKDSRALSQWCDSIRQEHDSIAGIVHLAQVGSDWLPSDAPIDKWNMQLNVNEKSFFTILHDFSEMLKDDAHVVSVSSLGGDFNRYSCSGQGLSLQGGFVGLLKSMYKERSQLRVKAVDMDQELSVETVSSILMTELELVGGRQEVGYPGGQRTVFRTTPAQLHTKEPPQQAAGDQVILVTGGARGITAETIRELALPGHILLLTGRSVFEEQEPQEFKNLSDFNSIRQYFVSKVRAGELKLNMAGIRQRVRSVMNAREMRSNIEDFRLRGAEVQYFQVDVNDETAMQHLIEMVYNQYGHIDGVVHGAGIIEDKLLADKDSVSWSRVVETKVIGLLLLQKYIRPETLKFLTVFSSVAGRFGNSGQSDYATANEMMNRLCSQLSRFWHNKLGSRVKVKALCWGPWGKTQFGAGMVTDFTKEKFDAQGILLVDAEAGRRLFREELASDDDEHVEIICGHGPWEKLEAEVGRIEKGARQLERDERQN